MASSRASIDPAPKPFRGPWEGESKIVVGIDIGTTQSGVAFTFLQQGASQTMHRIKQWPGQPEGSKQGKTPTVIWYDSNNKAVSFGAEAMSPDAEGDAEDNGWQLAKHFKLHLHPSDMQAKHDLKLEPLPVGITLRQIYTDFLGYLLQETKKCFESTIGAGPVVWENHKDNMEVVIAHPNGWGIREQAFLRSAAIESGFTTAENAPTKVRFVTEAEASVHYCIYHTNLGNRLQPGANFAVCDAGGSTVDTTLYSVESARPVLKLKEMRASACVQAGAIFVDAEMVRYLKSTLSRAGLPAGDMKEYTKAGLKDFEEGAKRQFSDITTDYHVKLAPIRFNNSDLNTRRGRMMLPGSIMESFFHHCSEEIKKSVDQQIQGLSVPYILLVGGFGDSPFIRQEFKTRYVPQGCQITIANDSASKAVADGALIWNIISSVFSRAPRSSIGAIYGKAFNPFSDEQLGRETHLITPGFPKVVTGYWGPVVSKGVSLDENVVCRQTLHRIFPSSTPDLESFTATVYSYSGDDQPQWAYDKQDELMPGFRKACVVSGDLSQLSGALEAKEGIYGMSFWDLTFDICIKYGGTEWQGFLEWKENGVTRTGPVTIVPESTVED